jgi:glycosyltransferase involved in cell wall biosynthesis
VRVLFVHETNYLSKVIYEMHEFPELLALRGHDVTFFHYPEAPTTQAGSWHARRELISGRAYPDARITLVTPPTFGGGTAERYLAPILDAPSLRREIVSGRYDAVVLYAVPTTGWQTIRFARRLGVPVIFRALDVSHKIRRTPVSALIRLAERYVYRNATLISANNEAMAEYCVSESGRTGPAVVNLPPVDLDHFRSVAVSREAMRRRLGIADESRVIVYMGSFFSFSGLDAFLERIASSLREDPLLHVLLVGGGHLERRLHQLVHLMDLSNRVTFTGVVPYRDLPDYLQAADVAVNPFQPQLLTHIALPHKVMQYMAAGVPAVSTLLRGLHSVLGDDSGVQWAEGPGAVADAALRLATAPAAQLRAAAARQSDVVDALFSADVAAADFEQAILSIR